MTQRSPVIYAKAIQYTFSQKFGSVPVYASFNRNWANEETFVTWQMHDIHQEVYPDVTATASASLKGIDRPRISVVIHSTTFANALQSADSFIQSLHGYQGWFGNTATTDKFDVRKIDIFWLTNEYDNEINLHQILLECTLDIPS